MKLTWYGHSCFLLESKDGSVVFDPYAPGSVPGLELPELTADKTICSHKHSDHFYPQGVRLTGREPALTVTQLPTFHDGKGGAQRGNNLIAVVAAEGLRVAHFGDIGHALSPEQLEELGHIDVMLVPVGGYYTIDAKQATALVQAVKPTVVIPMHYRGAGFGYDVIAPVEEFLALAGKVKRLETNVLELNGTEDAMTAVPKCPESCLKQPV